MSIETMAREFVAATKKRAQARSHLSALRKKWIADNDAFWDKYESDGMEGHNDMLEALHDREQANAEYRRAKSRLFRACALGVSGIDTADHVHHGPTGETWVVARVDREYLHPCGWPPSRADLKDCTLVKKASPDERTKLLQELAAGRSEHAGWAKDALGVMASPMGSVPCPDEDACIRAGKCLERCGQPDEARRTAGVTACPESGKHCKPVNGECQTCGAVGVKGKTE